MHIIDINLVFLDFIYFNIFEQLINLYIYLFVYGLLQVIFTNRDINITLTLSTFPF